MSEVKTLTPYQAYEKAKKALQEQNLTAKEYEQKIKQDTL